MTSTFSTVSKLWVRKKYSLDQLYCTSGRAGMTLFYLIYIYLIMMSSIPARWKQPAVSDHRILHPSQLISVWSRLVMASSEQRSSTFTRSDQTDASQPPPRRTRRPLQDPVRISHGQLWHLAGGRQWTLHPWPRFSCGTDNRTGSRVRWWTILSASHLLLLWPHAASLEVGLELEQVRDRIREWRGWICLLFSKPNHEAIAIKQYVKFPVRDPKNCTHIVYTIDKWQIKFCIFYLSFALFQMC